jgi:hypothetical protein
VFIGILIVVTIVIFGSAAAIQFFVSPAELHDMGIWLDHPQF